MLFILKSKRGGNLAINVKTGTKLKMALDVPVGQEPDFSLLCTFNKALDESAFLVSIPMKGGKPLEIDDNQKLLMRYEEGSETMILAGYVDDVVKEGIRRYWKIRRVTEQRQFFQRSDERVKVTMRIEYMQSTWPANVDGEIVKEDAMSLDISGGGLAMYLNRRFQVGEICEIDLPNFGTSEEGRGLKGIISTACWNREAPKGSIYRNICGLQFKLSDEEKKHLNEYIDFMKKKYRL